MVRCKNCFWAEQLIYVIFLSIQTFSFDLILESFFDFLGPQWAIFVFWGDYFLWEFCPMHFFLLLNYGEDFVLGDYVVRDFVLVNFCLLEILSLGISS